MLYRLLSRLGAEKYLSSSYFSSWLILAIDTVVSVFSTFVAYLLIRGLFPHPVFTVWYGVASGWFVRVERHHVHSVPYVPERHPPHDPS